MTVRVIYPPLAWSVNVINHMVLISDGSPLWLRNVHVIQFGSHCCLKNHTQRFVNPLLSSYTEQLLLMKLTQLFGKEYIHDPVKKNVFFKMFTTLGIHLLIYIKINQKLYFTLFYCEIVLNLQYIYNYKYLISIQWIQTDLFSRGILHKQDKPLTCNGLMWVDFWVSKI